MGEATCKSDRIKCVCKEAYLEGLEKPVKKFNIILGGIRTQTPLNYHIVVLCFPLELEMFSALFILSHTDVSTR